MKKIAVLGGGESGVGAAVLAKKEGFDVFLSDSGMIGDKYKAVLDSHDIPYEERGHDAERLYQADEIIKSPGIPDSAVLVRDLRSRCIPVISEIEFAGRYLQGARTICVTGSNGKTTVATLIHAMLKEAGYDVELAGNIGTSLAYSVANGKHKWYVLEISSFQLDGMPQFIPHIAVMTNITPDHLDRYEYDFEKYAASKMSIIRNQGHDDWFIFSHDDPTINRELAKTTPLMRMLPFSLRENDEQLTFRRTNHNRWQGAYLSQGEIVAEIGDHRTAIPVDGLKLKGKHNLCNIMASALAAMAAGVAPEYIRKAVSAFGGVEHRLEDAGVVGNVEFINDSKATNTDSAWYALDGMDKPVIWIAGGTDKGNDYAELKELAKDKVKALVCLGADNSKLAGEFSDAVPRIYDTSSMAAAVSKAFELAEDGDVVLLSPACASFDLFKNYEDRGRQFKTEVQRLKKN